MLRGDAARSTPVRLALAFSGLTIAAFVISGGIGYYLMHAQLSVRQDVLIREMFDAIASRYEQSDDGYLKGERPDHAEVLEPVQSLIDASRDRAFVLSLQDSAGNVLARNIGAYQSRAGWSDVEGSELGIDTRRSYRVFDGAIGTLRLMIGQNNAGIEAMREVFLGALGWSIIAVLLISLTGGAAIAARAQQRLNDISRAMARVADGDLAARIPLSAQADDIDRLGQEINAALNRLESNVEAMRQVSSDIAHDLRTPLNRLHMRIESAMSKAAPGQELMEDLEAATAESENISRTFSALLRIAQIEAGARRAKFAAVNLSGVLENISEVYQEVAEDAGMKLYHQTVENAWVHGDRDLLTQLIANLVENAIRHCPLGTRISCAVMKDMRQVTLRIADNGGGIPQGERSKVLRRLYRLEKSRTTPGSGLGFSLIKAIADLHGAELHLEDAAPGLAVTLVFPAGRTPLKA